jgi:hypothetical protein
MIIPSIVFLIFFNDFGIFTFSTCIRTEWNSAIVNELCFVGSGISNYQLE